MQPLVGFLATSKIHRERFLFQEQGLLPHRAPRPQKQPKGIYGMLANQQSAASFSAIQCYADLNRFLAARIISTKVAIA